MDNSLQKYILVLYNISILVALCLLLLHMLSNLIIIICNKRGIDFSILFGHYQLAPYQIDEYQQKHRNGYETEGYLEDSDEE